MPFIVNVKKKKDTRVRKIIFHAWESNVEKEKKGKRENGYFMTLRLPVLNLFVCLFFLYKKNIPKLHTRTHTYKHVYKHVYVYTANTFRKNKANKIYVHDIMELYGNKIKTDFANNNLQLCTINFYAIFTIGMSNF